MSVYRFQRAASARLDEIYHYTAREWGAEQAERYLRGLFARLDDLAARRLPWRHIPAEFGVTGFYCRYERHFIYLKMLEDDSLGVVTILHERMHQIDAFRDDAV